MLLSLEPREMADRNHDVNKADGVQKKWLLMKKTWLKCSKEVCGMTKGIEMWKRRLSNEIYVTKPGCILNMLKLNIL